MKTLTHEFMATAVLPLTAYETRYTYHELSGGHQLVAACIDKISVTGYGPLNPDGNPVLQFSNAEGVNLWGPPEAYFTTAEAAQEDINTAWAEAEANPPYPDQERRLMEQRVEIERLRGLLLTATTFLVAAFFQHFPEEMEAIFNDEECDVMRTHGKTLGDATDEVRRCFDATQKP